MPRSAQSSQTPSSSRPGSSPPTQPNKSSSFSCISSSCSAVLQRTQRCTDVPSCTDGPVHETLVLEVQGWYQAQGCPAKSFVKCTCIRFHWCYKHHVASPAWLCSLLLSVTHLSHFCQLLLQALVLVSQPCRASHGNSFCIPLQTLGSSPKM